MLASIKRSLMAAALLCAMVLGSSPSFAQTFGCDWFMGLPSGSTCPGTLASGGTSPTSYMVSHRFQRHSVFISSDNSFHVLVNKGTTDNALQILTSTNSGSTWASKYSFAGTTTGNASINGLVSTDDVLLGPTVSGVTTMYVVYDVDAAAGSYTPALKFAKMLYTSSTHTWAMASGYPQTIISNSTVTYQSPAMAIDSSGNIWVTNNETFQVGCPMACVTHNDVVLWYNPSGTSNWAQASTSFFVTGSTGNGYAHAAHPMVPPSSSYGNMGVLFQSEPSSTDNCVYWLAVSVSGTYPSLTFTTNTSGGYEQIVCNMPAKQAGTEDSGYSVVADSAGSLYMGVVQLTSGTDCGASNCKIETFKQTSAVDWAADGYLDTGNHPTTAVYVKSFQLLNATFSYVGMMINDQGNLLLYTHKIGGMQEWVLQGYYTHPTAGAGQSYGNPRIEVPMMLSNSATLPLPVWEQYTIDSSSNQSFIGWNSIAINN